MTKSSAKTKEEQTPQKKNGMYIVRVQLKNDNTATVFYRTTTDKDAKEVYYSGKEEVTEEFKTTFKNAVDGFLGVIPRLAPDKEKITMNAIKFDYDKSGFLKSALYSVKYAFNDQNNAVINISTPPLPIYKEGMENTFTIAGIHEDALHEVLEKTKAYINGETRIKQMKLVVDNSEG